MTGSGWRARALCADQDPARFDRATPDVILLCSRCPVAAACATDALLHGTRATVRAGVDCSTLATDRAAAVNLRNAAAGGRPLVIVNHGRRAEVLLSWRP